MQLLENVSENVFGMFLKHDIPTLIFELIDRLQIIKFLNMLELKEYTPIMKYFALIDGHVGFDLIV